MPEADRLGDVPPDDAITTEGETPCNQASLRSSWDLGRSTELDLWLRYVDEMPARDVPAYTEMDLRFGWRPTESLELSIVGRNLLDDRHTRVTP